MTTSVSYGGRRPRLRGGQHRRRPLVPLVKWVAAAAAAALVATLAFVAAPAQAASYGPGYNGGLGHLGSYVHNGQQVYCLEPEAAPATGNTDGGYIGGFGAMNATQLAQLNYVIRTFGQTGSNVQAAAVSLYTWSVASPGDYNSHGYNGDVYYAPRAGADAAAVRATLNNIRAAAANVGPASTPSGSASLSIDMANSYSGTVTVSTNPGNARGYVYLTGATFTDGSTRANAANGSRLAIRGNPSAEAGKYAITARGDFSADVASGYAGNIRVYSTPGAQRLAGPGEMSPAAINFSTDTYQTDPLPLQFNPVISTTTSQVTQPGIEHADTLRVTASSAGQQWRQSTNGTYLPVVARGTLYGPLSAPPTTTGVPVGTPVADTLTMTLNGPGTYTARSDKAEVTGFFQWVWEIRAADQSARVQTMLPANYRWVAAFNDRQELTRVPTKLTASTAVSNPELGLLQPVTDTVTVTHDPSTGEWPVESDGTRRPVTLNGSAYWVGGTEAPALSDTPPADAQLLLQTTLQTTEPGVLESEAATPTIAGDGFVVWQWHISADSYFQAWSDPFGVPAEMSKYISPALTTVADTGVALGDPAKDVATIEGLPTGQPLELRFEAWLQPEGVEEPVCVAPVDAPTEEEDVSLSLEGDVAAYEGMVFDTSAEPILFSEAGVHESAPADFEAAGTYNWIATIESADGQVVARGECGELSEITDVHDFSVTTSASPVSYVGDESFDVATVEGLTPQGSYLTFAAYLQPADATEPVCDVSNRVFDTSDEPMALAGAGEYESARTVLPSEGLHFWVASAFDRNGELRSEGVCGDPEETTHAFSVSTTATSSVTLGEDSGDVATIVGSLPEGSTIRFAAFKQSSAELTCVPGTSAYESDALVVDGAGAYPSPTTVLPETGHYEWVATVFDADGEILHTAECGAAGERTDVKPVALAFTGLDLAPLAALALGMVLVGGSVLLIARSRRQAASLVGGPMRRG